MRIIAGEFRGRIVASPPGETTRPITDRVKAALFNILMPRLEGAVVLDLFCGTGSMGLEALSRGSVYAAFAELDRPALAGLDRNIAALRLADRCRVWRGDILAELPGWLAGLDCPADIAFIDPPYAMVREWDWAEAARQLFDPVAASLAPDGIAMLRVPRALAVPQQVGQLTVIRRREYGTMALVFLARQQ